jgi:hypothetical protein
MKFSDIRKKTPDSGYAVTCALDALPAMIVRYEKNFNLELNPDFQRGHVWTRDQQIAYVENLLSGGVLSNVVRFNHPNWQGSYEGQMVCVDGLQRLSAATLFLADQLPAFGHLYSEFEGQLPREAQFTISVNSLKTRKEVLQWYLELNAGGTPHASEEIIRVRELLSNS